MTDLATIAEHLDMVLGTDAIPDYPGALNGIQLENQGAITGIAAAVDVSRRTIGAVVDSKSNLLLVHHGMFWSGTQAITGVVYERLRLLIANNIAVYSTHLPLDAHPTFGNNALLARALDLHPSGGFARYKSIDIGVRGECDRLTVDVLHQVEAFSQANGGTVRCTGFSPARRTQRWGICTGAGASPETLVEAKVLALDTLIVGEGPHHTAVAAEDLGIVVIYAGHYATETLGVRALAEHLTDVFRIPSTFIAAPTGL
jgi:dinuclear metal center YbgI/SA1388 family protein